MKASINDIQQQITKCLTQFKTADEYNINHWCGFPHQFASALAALVESGNVVEVVRHGRFGILVRYKLNSQG